MMNEKEQRFASGIGHLLEVEFEDYDVLALWCPRGSVYGEGAQWRVLISGVTNKSKAEWAKMLRAQADAFEKTAETAEQT